MSDKARIPLSVRRRRGHYSAVELGLLDRWLLHVRNLIHRFWPPLKSSSADNGARL